jgi:hypothetical protein
MDRVRNIVYCNMEAVNHRRNRGTNNNNGATFKRRCELNRAEMAAKSESLL